MANIVYIATSLDGFIADKDEGLDWLTTYPTPEGSDMGFGDFMARIDALVMGRNTYEMVAAFDGEWPYPVPVFVLSRTLTEIPAAFSDKVELISGSPAEISDALGARGFTNLYIDGGRTIQSFLAADRIDELIITRVPILLGGGFPLFGDLAEPLHFEHAETESFSNGMTQSRYLRKP